MKIKPSHKSKLPRAAVLTIVLLLLLGAGTVAAYYYKIGPFADSSRSSESSGDAKTKNPSDQTNDQKKVDVKGGTTSDNVDTTKTTDQIPKSTVTSVTIDSLAQQNGVVSYSASVGGASSGTCSAVFSNDIGKPVSRTVDTTNGTCSAVIPENEFDALGKWTLTLRFYANNTQTVSTKDIVIK